MRPSNGQRYLIGQKRCQVCQIFINWEGVFCPCCGYKLRVTPRNKKFKQILRNLKKLDTKHYSVVQYFE
ncbi:MAG: hypothetical protein ACXWFB_02980 [Nitrososphaeraceae archaeon]